MAKIKVYVHPKPKFTLGRLTDSLPTAQLQRLANPAANFKGHAMVRREQRGGSAVEFRCYLGMLIPDEMEDKHLGQWIEEEENNETIELIRHIYRVFGPMDWGSIGRRFDALCRRFGDARIGRAVQQRAQAELDWRLGLPEEATYSEILDQRHVHA